MAVGECHSADTAALRLMTGRTTLGQQPHIYISTTGMQQALSRWSHAGSQLTWYSPNYVHMSGLGQTTPVSQDIKLHPFIVVSGSFSLQHCYGDYTMFKSTSTADMDIQQSAKHRLDHGTKASSLVLIRSRRPTIANPTL